MTRKSQQFRAVVLAALMVLSVFAGTIAFTGSAAATTPQQIDLGAGNGTQVSVEAGSSATFDATVYDEDGSTSNETVVWVDLNGDGVWNASEPNGTATDSSDSISIPNIDIGGLAVDTYNVSTAQATGVGEGATANLTVEDQLEVTASEAPVLQSAVHYDNDTTSSVDAEVELAFDEDVTVDELNVSVEGDSENLTQDVIDVKNGRVVATLGQVYTEDLEVTYKVTDTQGNTYSNAKTDDVDFAAVSVKADDTKNAYKGSTVAVIAGNASADVEITGTDDDNNFFRSGSTGTNSHVYTLDTTNRDLGDYEVVFDGGQVANVTIRDLGLGVSIDDLTVTNDDDSVIEGTVSANAGDRPVTIELLDSDEETQMTIGADLTGQAEYDFEFNASDLDAGNYTVLVTDNQSSVEAESSSIEVSKAGKGRADIGGTGIVTEQRGDVANITVTLSNTDYATLTFGSEDVGYVSNVTVEDENGDGKVNVLFNTYAATGVSNLADDGGKVYNVPNLDGDDDDITKADISEDVGTLLDAGEYDVEVRSGEDASADSQGVGTLVLEERNTTSVASWTAPSGTSLDDTDDVYEAISNDNITQDDGIAYGDLAVHQIQASGLYGAIEADGDATDVAFYDVADTGAFNFSVEQVDPGANRDPYSLILNETNTDVFADEENDTYFIVYDTDSSDIDTTERSIENDHTLEANFTVAEDEGNLADERQTVTDQYELVEGEHTLDEPVNVSAASGQTVAGETTVAPGTELSLRVRSSGDTQPSFLKTASVYVTENNTFSATFDFSEQEVGDTFEVTVRNGPADSVSADGNVAEGGAATETEMTGTEATGTEMTDTATVTEASTDTATATEASTDTATATEASTDDTETSTGTPGFGAVVAVTALLAAALLAVRRD
jgi:surface glycoprotein (TIGR04207 family)/PGF-CTERM protein